MNFQGRFFALLRMTTFFEVMTRAVDQYPAALP
jgi:hypothetical protein